MKIRTFCTSESVTPKHPDKICDQISDAVLDACLETDPNSRAAVEVAGGHGMLFVTGEITTAAKLDLEAIARRFVPENYRVEVNVALQSPEIARGVDTGGAGDQGIMNGYACSENPAMIPHELYLARMLAKKIYALHEFDGKTQVTLDGIGQVTSVVASFQNTSTQDLQKLVAEFIAEYKLDTTKKFKLYCNPSGDWQVGGFDADAGLTGRKIAIDNYGASIPIGGGAYSGKDATKVDRSGAYMARKIAVDYLKQKGAKEVFVQLAYSIGIAEPVQAVAYIDDVAEPVRGYDLTPKGIIDTLQLCNPQYLETARWGHYGNGFTWDK